MTKTRTPVSDLPAKHDEGDVLRSVAESVFQLMAEADVEGLVGAGRRERRNALRRVTIDDLTKVLIRWIVDAYHNTPHAGLGGQTPLDAWDELVERWGVLPPPDLRARRLAFGRRLARKVQRTGIQVLGVTYSSEALQRWRLHSRKHDVAVRWHPGDLGAIEVKFDGAWREVPAVIDGFHGRTAQEWVAATRQIRASNQNRARVREDVVLQAFADIDSIAGAAARRADILVHDWSSDRISGLEDRLFIGFEIAPTPAMEAPEPIGPKALLGTVIPVGGDGADELPKAASSADAGSSAAPDRTGLRERFAWRFGVVTACPIHGVALVDALQGDRLGGHDALTAEVADRWRLIAAAAAAPSAREPTPLQRYVLQRLDGVAGPAWLDAQRLDQAVRSCELLGAVTIGGARPGQRHFDADTLDRARAIGFEAAAGGPAAIREVLSAMQRRDGAQSGNAGPPAVFGALYAWADHPSNRQSPLATVLRTHIVETMPVGPGDTLFGAPVTERRVHSARTLALACGVDAKRLRKTLISADVIGPETDVLDDNRCVFDAAAGETVANVFAGGMTLKQFAAALGIALPRARALVSAGLIRPSVLPDPDLGLRAFSFAGQDVADLVAGLLDGAAPVCAASPGFVTVDAAARAAGQPVVTVLGAVLDGRLPERQRVADAPGITGLRVRQDAAVALFPPEPLVGYWLLTEAAEWLGVPYASMAFLLRNRQGGALIATEAVEQGRRRHVRAIPETVLAAFDRQYVTPRKLARELAVSGMSLTLQVDKLALSPVFDPSAVKTRLYWRVELEAAIRSLTLKPLKPHPRQRSAGLEAAWPPG